MFNKNDKSAKERENSARAQMAARPSELNIGMLMPEAKEVITQYLLAIFSMDADLLPMKKMGEGIYNTIGNRILTENRSLYRREVYELEITNISPMDYENEFTHISKISYEVSYHITGTQISPDEIIPFSFKRDASYVFTYDQRLGWILTECLKDVTLDEF